MAGSWGHMVVDEPSAPEDASTYTAEDIGKPYRDRDGAFSLVENMGDAVEAMEECYGMVWALAARVVENMGMGYDRAAILGVIEAAHDGWKDGYELGAGEPPRW